MHSPAEDNMEGIVDIISISDSESSTIGNQSKPNEAVRRESSMSQNNEEIEVVTLSSLSHRSTERCPVTWNQSAKKSNLHFLSADTFYSPSPRSKVTNWLSENAVTYTHATPEQNAALSERHLTSLLECTTDGYTSAKSKTSILVRQDYKKPAEATLMSNSQAENISATDHNITNGNSVLSFGYNASDQNQKILISDKFTIIPQDTCNKTIKSQDNKKISEIMRISTPVSVRNMHSLVENMSILCDSQQTSASDASSPKREIRCKTVDVPLSPENQKKIELCQYLKLMNMNTDKKVIRIRQNRRSSRVKHLALMLERQKERKLNSEMDESEKKRVAKVSDSECGHSSDNGKGSKTSSSKRSNSVVESTESNQDPIPKEVSVEKVESVKNVPKQPERRSSVKTPAKFLQVPEVSTTSFPKSKTIATAKSSDQNKIRDERIEKPRDAKIKHKDNGLNDSPVENITKKSFRQLCMDVKVLKPLKNMRSTDSTSESTSSDKTFNFSFVESAMNIPKICCDFDDCIQLFVNPTTMNLIKNISKGEIKRMTEENAKKEINRTPKSIEVGKKRKVKNFENGPKTKMPKLNGTYNKRNTRNRIEKKKKLRALNIMKERKKLMNKGRDSARKKYASPKHVNKLRSRGRLKQVGLNTILLKGEKRKFVKRKVTKKSQFKRKPSKNKIIESSPAPVNTKENETPKEEKQERSNIAVLCAPTKMRLKSELDMWKNLTPEHRKALFESKKFLDTKMKESPVKTTPAAPIPVQDNAEEEKIADHEESAVIEKVKELEVAEINVKVPEPTDEEPAKSTTVLYDANTSPVVLPGTEEIDKSTPCSEDLEVDQLMSCKRLKDQATQKDCESPDVVRSDTMQTDGTDSAMADHSRCTSTSNPSSNSWSLQTVQSNPEDTTSSSKDIVAIAYNALNHHKKFPINDRVTDLPSSTRDTEVSQSNDDTFPNFVQPEVVNISEIEPTTCELVPMSSNESDAKSLHECLLPTKKIMEPNWDSSPTNQKNWKESFETGKMTKVDRKSLQSHRIYLSNINGAIKNAYYLDYNLIVVQDLVVSFWSQTPLGNVLGAQDMWIPKGSIRRMILGNGCVHKESSEMVISSDNSVAYVELWTKEHKSDKRERPVADIFVAIYLRLSRNGPNKKVLQLENIHGYATDVQYIVLRNSRSIIVSWSVINDTVASTVIHCYHLSLDYQSVTSIEELQAVGQYVSSLHNIEDCDTLILGCGEHKITLWNLEDGGVVATIDLTEIQLQPRTLWAKCDRGFLFTLHHVSGGVLHLIAINSFDSTWKRLQTYKPELEHDNLLGACMENGLLVAFYDTGVSCWSAQTGELILEDPCEDCVFLPFGKHVVIVMNNQVHVRHALEYLVTIEES